MRVRFVAIVAVVGVLAAACGGSTGHSTKSSGPSPSPSASGARSGTPSPSSTEPVTTGPGVHPGEKPPVLGALAKQHTPPGALAFANYYYQAFSWGYATTDPLLVQQISAASCRACRRYVDGLKGVRARGAHVEGGRVSVQSAVLTTGKFTIESDYAAEVKLSETPVVLVGPSSLRTTAAPAITHDTSLVFVSWAARGWRVVEVGAP